MRALGLPAGASRASRPIPQDEFVEHLATSAAAAKSRVSREQILPIERIIREAWSVGQAIDLSNIGYGPAHWSGDKPFYDTPSSYYQFLAGLVRTQNCQNIFEVGTHYGGSSLSMLRGIGDSTPVNVLTVDLSDLNPVLHETRGLTKLVGDANSEHVIKTVLLHFGGAPIDLFFIDADHEFLPTLTNLGLYCLLLRPRFVVVDDIVLNHRMRSMWDAVLTAEAVDCVDVVPEIREREVGFGLMKLR